jgi:hypothetical protein
MPDSLEFYTTSMKKMNRYTEYYNELIHEEDSILDKRDSIFKKHNIRTAADLNRVYPQLPRRTKTMLSDIASGFRSITDEKNELLRDPNYLNQYQQIQRFLRKINILPIGSIIDLTRVEQKTIIDYYSEE